MGEAIGGVIGFALGIAVSPVPIAAVILMLFSDRARSNGLSFMTAWVLGIATVTAVVLLVPGLESDTGAPSTTTGWIKLVLGVLLLVAGFAQWRSRPGTDQEAPMPGWMGTIDSLKPAPAFGLGFLLSAINPKNFLLAAAAGATIGSVNLGTGQTAATAVIFTALAGLSVVVPVIAYLVAGDRLDPAFENVKEWLIRNNSTVMSVLFFVFGVNLLGDAIAILAG